MASQNGQPNSLNNPDISFKAREMRHPAALANGRRPDLYFCWISSGQGQQFPTTRVNSR